MRPTPIQQPIVRLASSRPVALIAFVVCVAVGVLAVPLTGTFPGTSAGAARPAEMAADDLPIGAAKDVGMSAERLLQIDEVITRAIDTKQISGAVTLVARHGKIAHFEAHGLMDIEAGRAMEKDTIFPIASMTKPVSGVAILMLVEEGKVRLSDPVSRFIPEFHATQVAIARPSAGDDEPDIYMVPADREITVRDLLTHTSGLVSGGAGSREASRIAPRGSNDTLATYTAALGDAPLDFQPGTDWAYSGLAGIDTVARIVEVASGLTFDEFLRQRIFEPLGMLDTGFNVPPERAARVVTLYGRTPTGLERREVPAWVDTETLFSGGGGLWSTAGDYVKFAQMLVNRGELGAARLLGSKTVELMASNHVGDLYAVAGRTGGGMGKGFGLTVDVVLDAVTAQDNRSTGSFGWSGAFGTTFWVDWQEEMTAILMVQTPGGPLRADFQNAVRQSVID
jgi:CubicO group peptidase (beta-lactamase class C family)